MFPLCGEAMHLHSPIPSRDFTINAPSFPNNNFVRYQVLQWHHICTKWLLQEHVGFSLALFINYGIIA